MKYSVIVCLGFMLSSCASMFNGAVLPNQCKRCQVINRTTNQILSTFEGCGSENTRLEEQAKESAYDLSRNGNLCQLDVVCETWKKEPEETAKPIEPAINQHREN